MAHEDDKRKHPRSLGEVIRIVLERRRKWLPTSFYLLLATPIALVLGARMGQLQEDPRRFFIILSLLFLFFGVVFHRALMDVFDLIRRNVLGTRDLYKDTFDGDFKGERKVDQDSAPDEPHS